MGVHATFCQLCGLPTQHDHYVQGHGLWNIFRGSMPGGEHDWSREPHAPFAFTAEHAWLRDAVGVLRDEGGVLRGEVEDGGLHAIGSDEDVYVGDGTEDAVVFHHACWELLGQPETADDTVRGLGGLAWAQLAPYQQQLFEFAHFTKHGKGAWLEAPSVNALSRRRVDRLLIKARRRGYGGEVASLADLVRFDDDWFGTVARANGGEGDESVTHHVQHRRGVSELLDLASHPHLLCVMRHYPPEGLPEGERWLALDELAVELQGSLEGDGLGVAVLHSVGGGKSQFLAYVRDLTEAHRRVEALDASRAPGPLEYDDAHDPTWNVFFNEMGVRPR